MRKIIASTAILALLASCGPSQEEASSAYMAMYEGEDMGNILYEAPVDMVVEPSHEDINFTPEEIRKLALEAKQAPDDDAVFAVQMAMTLSHSLTEFCPSYAPTRTEEETMAPIEAYYDAHPDKLDALQDESFLMKKMLSFGLGLGYTPADFARWADGGDDDPAEACDGIDRIMAKYPFTRKHVTAVE